MKIMNYWCKFLCVGLYLIVFGSVACQGQKNKKEVVYRDYTHMEADLLDSLKRDEVKTLFCGVHALRQQAQQVKENTPVRLVPRRAEKKKLSPQDMIEGRRESVLTVNKVSSCDDGFGRGGRLGNSRRVVGRRDLCFELSCVLGIS